MASYWVAQLEKPSTNNVIPSGTMFVSKNVLMQFYIAQDLS